MFTAKEAKTLMPPSPDAVSFEVWFKEVVEPKIKDAARSGKDSIRVKPPISYERHDRFRQELMNLGYWVEDKYDEPFGQCIYSEISW